MLPETIAYNHLKRIETAFHLWDPETEIVLPDAGLLFEVKYQTSISSADLRQVAKNAERTGFDPYVITKETADTRTVDGEEVAFVPLYVICQAI